MDTRPDRPQPVTPDELMRYLDGEMSPEERQRVDAELKASTELQREVAMYKNLKHDMQDLHFHPGTRQRSVWDQVNAHVNRPMGWGLLVFGTVIWMVYGTWVFATSSASPWEKLGTGAVAIGVLMLLTSVIWERYRDYQTDPYRNVQR
ncbi:MAG: hypothetical protein AAF389_01360 [Gemmatimonadota bacterium]